MALPVPITTRAILDSIEGVRQPTSALELSTKLSGLHQAVGLADAERKGAWAESLAFSFRPVEESPWGTHYGPIFTATKEDGTPYYGPDIAEVDEEIVEHWAERSNVSQHPVLRARYADVVWDLKKRAINKPADVSYAQRAIDAYLDAVTNKLYQDPTLHSAQATIRSLHVALSITDVGRIQQSKQAMVALFDETTRPGHTGVWTILFDGLTESKKVGLTLQEIEHLIKGLNHILTTSTTTGEEFDSWAAQAAALRLASYYELQGKKEDAQHAIRVYGTAFEQMAAQASPLLAMTWLQSVHDEYKNRGMTEDAARVQLAIAEKGKNVASDLKTVRTTIEITEKQMGDFVSALTQGTYQDALQRIATHFVPNTNKVKDFLKDLLTRTPLLALLPVSRISGDHFGAQAGSIEGDPEGRLIMQLAQHLEIQSVFLRETLVHLRSTGITADPILSFIDESPVFTPERRPLLQEGIQAYLDDDHTKAIHVLIPQIEQGLRELLTLTGVPSLKPGRNGMMQLKNLNDILRESMVKASLGEDVRLYLLTFLADERGLNFRNLVCHGLAGPDLFTQGLADQTLHALLTLGRIRAKSADDQVQ